MNNFAAQNTNNGMTYFIETHGCQMNVADSELVDGILSKAGY